MIETEWGHAVIELVGMAAVAFGFIWAIKSDTRVLKVRLDSVDGRLNKMESVIETLSNQKSRIDVIDERMLAQGKRLDEVSKLLAQVSMRYAAMEYSKEQGS